MSTIPDVLIVGAGAIGASCASSLAAAGARVTLLERPGPVGAAWHASAGMLAAQIEAQPDDPLFDLALAGREYLVDNTPLLAAATGVDIGLAPCGILQVARSDEQADALKHRVGWQRQQALRADWLDDDEVADGWRWLSPCRGAFWSPEDGSLDPQQLVAAFRANAVRLGARLVSDTALGLDLGNDALRGVIGERERYAAGTVIIAAGAWSGRLGSLPRPLSVEPLRGQMMAFPWPAAAAPAIVYGDHCYLLRRGNEMLVGSTMEHAGFDANVTEAGLTGLQARASQVYPALAAMQPIRTWAGLRPGTPDGLPIIGPDPHLPGLWYATGHGRNGILLSGITGDLVARAISGLLLGEELQAFRPERFWDW